MSDEIKNIDIREAHEKAGINTDIGAHVANSIVESEKNAYLRTSRSIITPSPDSSIPELHHQLIDICKSYRPEEEVASIEKAYEFAKEKHKDQKRKSGEPYIIHPLNTAIILAGMEMDSDTIIAGLLHDVVEDTDTTLEDVKKEFGPTVALLVDGVTKLTQLSIARDRIEVQAENLRKMFVAMARDIRVVIIKLADRLHNLRTLQYQSENKQIEKAKETLEIYSPLASRLGISKLKIELDDLSLKYLKPDVYEELVQKTAMKKEEREKFISRIVDEVSAHLKDAEIDAMVVGRVKHFFSIYKKMVNQNKGIDEIYDLFAVRILVENVKDCYAALGVIHELYKPIPGRFKDYIAMPKQNMYQSLHTTLIGTDGTPFEIQIRTFEMHRVAEYGIAAHWKYKEKGSVRADSGDDEKMTWLRQVLEWQRDSDDSKEFLNMVKSDFDLFTGNVYCFTPTGEVKNLPAGSNTIDFAYAIHSAVGNKMVGARVNGKLVPIETELNNGDQVEIITAQNSKGPSRDWLSTVKSSQARNKINAWFKSELKDDNIARGKDLIDKYCKSKGLSFSDLNKAEFIDGVLSRYALKDWNTVLAAVGRGGLKESQVVGKLVDTKNKFEKKNITDSDILDSLSDSNDNGQIIPKGNPKGGISVKGMHDVAVRYGHCCNPVPGDAIIGYVTRGRGVTVHRMDCVNMINLPEEEKSRLIEANWHTTNNANDSYTAEIKVYCINRIGMVVDISRVLTEMQIDITSMNLKLAKNGTGTFDIQFEIHSIDEINKAIEKIRQIDGILDIYRSVG